MRNAKVVKRKPHLIRIPIKIIPKRKAPEIEESSIPPEVIEFLVNQDRQTMLVRGGAGTGKTTLVLQLLKELGGVGVYVSTRVSPKDVYVQYPWIREHIPENNIIDATKSYTSTEIIEDLTDGYAALPDALKNVYDIIKNAKKATVVVDSWEAVVEPLKTTKGDFSREVWTQEALEIEMMNQIKSKNANLILVLERMEPTRLDYLVDGVLSIHDIEIEGRPIRELEVNKLRGVRRRQKRYLTTLEGGKYRSFNPFTIKTIQDPQIWVALPDHDTHFTSGVRSMDQILGIGYSKGSFNVFEVDDTVPNWLITILLRPTLLNFARQSRGVVIVPLQGSGTETLKHELAPFLPEDKFTSYVRILSTVTEASATLSEYPAYVVLADASDPQKWTEAWEQALTELKEHTDNKPVVAFTGLDTVEHDLGPTQAIKHISDEIKLLSGGDDLALAVLKPGLQIAQQVRNIADTYFKVTEIDGTYVIYGKKPKTILYHVDLDISTGLPQIALTAIV
jgi:KaiC/GvpD/RAD55 family RecA-like ATPase